MAPTDERGKPERTLMLVDDEPDILGFMEMALREEGYSVVSVTSAIDALKAIDGKRPDLILLDAKMPVMDGREFLAVLRERKGIQVPVVLMTAARMAPAEAARLGAQGFLAKPFDLDDLLACVAQFLPRNSQDGQARRDGQDEGADLTP